MRSHVQKSEVAEKLGPLDRPQLQFLGPDYEQACVEVEVEVSPPWIYKLLGVYISYPLSVSYPLPIHIRTLQETVWCARIGPEREPSVSNYGILGARGGHLAAPAARPPDGDR